MMLQQDSTRLHTEGEARRRDRDSLALLALIGWQDLQRIDATWNRLAPRPYAGLTAAGFSRTSNRSETRRGAIQYFNEVARTFVVNANHQLIPVTTDANTVFLLDGQQTTFETAVRSGRPATVTYTIDTAGVRVASRVEFSSSAFLLPPLARTQTLHPLPSSPPSRFWFDSEHLQYGYGDRRRIPPTAIRTALNVFNANGAAELARITAAAGSGDIPISTWQDAMTQAVKDYQLVNAAVGRGGTVNLADGDLLTVSETLEYQYSRLDRFAEQMEEETAAPSPSAAGSRAGNYASSAITTYDGMRRRAAETAGYTLERNLLGNAEHCQPDPRRPFIPDCPSLSRMAWVPIGTLAPIGQRLCMWNCRCHIEYRKD